MTDPIERGRHSVLYNYAPGKVFWHERARTIERITAILQDPETHEPPVNKGQLKEKLRAEIRRYAASDLQADQLDSVRLNVYQPDLVRAEAFPPAFYCQLCGHLYIPPRDARTQSRAQGGMNAVLAGIVPPRCMCTSGGRPCGGALRQYDILTTHHCGASVFAPGEPTMGACRTHDTGHLHWHRQGSERASRWRIQCLVPGCPHVRLAHEAFFARHWGCPIERDLASDQRTFQSAPFLKATHYMSKVVNLLNSDQALRDLAPGRRAAIVAAAGVLRDAASFQLYKPGAGFDAWNDQYKTDTGGRPPDDLEKLRKERDAILQALPPGQVRDGIVAKYDADIAAATRPIADAVQQSVITQVVGKDGYLPQIRDTILYMDDSRGWNLDWLQGQGDVDDLYRTNIETAKSAAAALGIHDIRYEDRIPMTAALVGYTRGSYQPRSAKLNLFMPRGVDGGADVFVHNTSTEGLWIQLDPVATLAWLSRHTGLQVPLETTFPRALLSLQQMFDPSSFDTFGGSTHPWSEAHYGLLHTLSHLFIKAAGRVTGLEQEGVSEDILPFSNSFLIYANHQGEFTLGGLQIMTEHHLATALAAMPEDAHKCALNPVCHDKRASCHGCVHVGEVSCANFNRLLNRKLLIGSKGFWSTT